MRRTPLYRFHREHGRLGEYAGFEMPLWYKGPTEEHISVRNKVGIFDVSHMGRLLIKSSQSINVLNSLLTNNCRLAEVMETKHAFFCNSSGGIIDDVLIFRLGPEEFLLIGNAVNREKDSAWIDRNKGDLDITVEDLTRKVLMLAVQGPKASQTLQRVFGSEISRIARLRSSWHQLDEGKF